MELKVSNSGLSDLSTRLERAGMGDVSSPIDAGLLHESVMAYFQWNRQRSANTLTRSEVHGTTKKSVKQKGSGGARHGAVTAPIFVGGGVAFGPRPVKTVHKLNKGTARKALLESLRARLQGKNVVVVSGSGSVSGKTKEVSKFMAENSLKNVLFCVENGSLIARGARNLPKCKSVSPRSLNPYDVLTHQWLVVSDQAVVGLLDRVSGSSAAKSGG